MSLFKIRKDRVSYKAPVVKLVVSLFVVLGVKAGEGIVNTVFENQYATAMRVAFCVVAAICAVLCYQALMEIGYVYDNRHPNAAASVGAEEMTVDEVMDAVESDADVRVALLAGDETTVVGARPKSAASEDFTRTYFAGTEELDGPDALRAKLEETAKDGKLTVAAVGDVSGKKFARAFRKGNSE